MRTGADLHQTRFAISVFLVTPVARCPSRRRADFLLADSVARD